MPAYGIIADRWIPAEKLLGISHLLGGFFIFMASTTTDYNLLYAYIFLGVGFYMPTIALSNSVAYNALEKYGYDTIKDFPPIRVFGTIGFIAAMWTVDLTGFKQSEVQFYVSAIASLILGVYSFTLPHCPVSKSNEKRSFVEALGLKAFTLFKDKKMAIFFIFSMLLGAALQITNGFGDLYINSYANDPAYADTFGVKHSVILISLSQISETLCILLIPFVLKRFGIKKVMLMSMFAWVLRFGLFGTGDPGPGIWMLILSMIVYGLAFDFFNISGALFVNQETDTSIRSSAQGLFMIMTNGFGATIGSLAAGAWLVVLCPIRQIVRWLDRAVYICRLFFSGSHRFALIFKYKHDPNAIQDVKH